MGRNWYGFLQNCIFIDEAGFDINVWPSYINYALGTLAIVATPTAQAVPYTILGVISAMNIVNIEMRIP